MVIESLKNIEYNSIDKFDILLTIFFTKVLSSNHHVTDWQMHKFKNIYIYIKLESKGSHHILK